MLGEKDINFGQNRRPGTEVLTKISSKMSPPVFLSDQKQHQHEKIRHFLRIVAFVPRGFTTNLWFILKLLFGQKPAKKTIRLRKKTLHLVKTVALIRGVFLKLRANLTIWFFRQKTTTNNVCQTVGRRNDTFCQTSYSDSAGFSWLLKNTNLIIVLGKKKLNKTSRRKKVTYYLIIGVGFS